MNLVKITSAFLWCSAAPLVIATGFRGSADPFGTVQSEASPVTTTVYCDTNTCSNNGKNYVDYYIYTSNYCVGLDQGTNFDEWEMIEYQYTCPGGYNYWTCGQNQLVDTQTCSAYVPAPACPTGSCTPYTGGHPG